MVSHFDDSDRLKAIANGLTSTYATLRRPAEEFIPSNTNNCIKRYPDIKVCVHEITQIK
jgi:hypothetical protein